MDQPSRVADSETYDVTADGHDVMGGEFVPDDELSEDTQAATATAVTPQPKRKRNLRRPLLLLAPIVLIIGAIAFYLHGGRYEETDDAFVQSGLVSVSPDVAGRVVAIAVHDNERVTKGQLLFTLDPAPYQAVVDEAAAQLAAAESQVRSQRADYRQGQSELAAAQTRVRFAEREAARQKQLLAEGISSQAQYDQAVLAAQTARQQIQTTSEANAGIQATLTGGVNGSIAAQAGVRRAQAALDRAKLNLGYTVVRAPQNGTVAKVEQLQVGDYVTAQRPVFTLAGTRVWIEANFKENQLRYMRLGQPATVRIDAFPDLDLNARVTSFSPGTGGSFSVLPAENATGNWVKVVQRLPVILTLDRVPTSVPLHAGLSTTVTVDTGHKRHLLGPDTPPYAPRGAAVR